MTKNKITLHEFCGEEDICKKLIGMTIKAAEYIEGENKEPMLAVDLEDKQGNKSHLLFTDGVWHYGEKLTALEVPIQEQYNIINDSVNVKRTFNVHGMNVKIELTARFDESIINKPLKIFNDGIIDNCESLSEQLLKKVNDSLI